jgi:hypothetical protein
VDGHEARQDGCEEGAAIDEKQGERRSEGGAHITYATVADGVVYVIVSQPNNASTIKTFHLPTAASKPPNRPTPTSPHRSRTL